MTSTTSTIKQFSTALVLPILSEKISHYKELISKANSSSVQQEYLAKKLQQLLDTKRSLQQDELNTVIHQPLSTQILDYIVSSSTLKGATGPKIVYNVIANEQPLTIYVDKLTFEVEISH